MTLFISHLSPNTIQRSNLPRNSISLMLTIPQPCCLFALGYFPSHLYPSFPTQHKLMSVSSGFSKCFFLNHRSQITVMYYNIIQCNVILLQHSICLFRLHHRWIIPFVLLSSHTFPYGAVPLTSCHNHCGGFPLAASSNIGATPLLGKALLFSLCEHNKKNIYIKTNL